ncbi:MAG TPA: AAA family ATPase [Candidatus Egerieenecus merdigallinarum]|nr:AAA family ATPase [Candidatus Egerieenecus merdigallinarum]
MYPMGVLSGIGLERLDFAPITILYGGNGTGKTTALNVMAAKLGLLRDTPGNSSTFMEAYVRACRANLEEDIPAHSRMVTSDDVFDYMLNLRELNTHIDQEREKLFQEHTQARHTVFQLRNLDDYEELKKRNSARRKTQSAFVREQLGGNVREMSNGESALFYFKQRLEEDALYLLDEPENSLSAERQLELAAYLEESARYAGCQLVIATHSPFLLAMERVKIYDFDTHPVEVRRWTELKNVRVYADFFRAHAGEFQR